MLHRIFTFFLLLLAFQTVEAQVTPADTVSTSATPNDGRRRWNKLLQFSTAPVKLVTNDTLMGYTTIASAISAARKGDEVFISTGVYDEVIDTKDGVNITGQGNVVLTYTGSGSDEGVIGDGNDIDTVTISNVTVKQYRNRTGMYLQRTASKFILNNVRIFSDSSYGCINEGTIEGGYFEDGTQGDGGFFNNNSAAVAKNIVVKSAAGYAIKNFGTLTDFRASCVSTGSNVLYNTTTGVAKYGELTSTSTTGGVANYGIIDNVNIKSTAGSGIVNLGLAYYSKGISHLSGVYGFGFNNGQVGMTDSAMHATRSYYCYGEYKNLTTTLAGEGFNNWGIDIDGEGTSNTGEGHGTYSGISLSPKGHSSGAFGMSVFNDSSLNGGSGGLNRRSIVLNGTATTTAVGWPALYIQGDSGFIQGGSFTNLAATNDLSVGISISGSTVSDSVENWITGVTVRVTNPTAPAISGSNFPIIYLSDFKSNTAINSTMVLREGSKHYMRNMIVDTVEGSYYKVNDFQAEPLSPTASGNSGEMQATPSKFFVKSDEWRYANLKTWVPVNSIAGLKLWLRGDNVDLGNPDTVSIWTDLSGNGRHFTNATSNRNTVLYRKAINGNDAVTFYDSTRMDRTSGSTLRIGDFTMFIVDSTGTTDTTYWIHGLVDNEYIGITSDNKIVLCGATSGAVYSSAFSTKSWSIKEIRRSGSTVTFFENHVQVGTSVSFSDSITVASLSEHGYVHSHSIKGSIAELIIGAYSDSLHLYGNVYLAERYATTTAFIGDVTVTEDLNVLGRLTVNGNPLTDSVYLSSLGGGLAVYNGTTAGVIGINSLSSEYFDLNSNLFTSDTSRMATVFRAKQLIADSIAARSLKRDTSAANGGKSLGGIVAAGKAPFVRWSLTADTLFADSVTGASGVGDIEGVTAGDGIQGGGTSGTVTVNASPDYDGGLETVDDSLNIKVLASGGLAVGTTGARVDSNSFVATDYAVGLKLNAAAIDTSTVLFWADTTLTNGVATNYDVSLKLNAAAIDTSKVLFWADTTLTNGVATDYDLSLKLNKANVRDSINAAVRPIFAFGGGGGNAGDTAAFTTSTKYGVFFNKGADTIVVTSLKCVMGHGIGNDTLQVQISWDDSLNGAVVTNLNTAALPINSITTGTEDTSFDNAKIPPNVWVWCTTPVVTTGRKPTILSATLSGTLKR